MITGTLAGQLVTVAAVEVIAPVIAMYSYHGPGSNHHGVDAVVSDQLLPITADRGDAVEHGLDALPALQAPIGHMGDFHAGDGVQQWDVELGRVAACSHDADADGL